MESNANLGSDSSSNTKSTSSANSSRTDLTRTERCRGLRNEATFAESILWQSLRSSKLDGRKFTRQKGIGIYVVDFYCPEERLVIELDGSIHDDPNVREYDLKREAELRSMGLNILRFTNEQVVGNSDEFLDAIRAIWKGRERNPPLQRGVRSRERRAPKRSTDTRQRDSTP